MKLEDMQLGIRYIVTADSENQEFQVGDRIKLLENGDVLNITAGGWMEAANVPEATKGMEIVVDKEWLDKQRLYLLNKLQKLTIA